MADDEKKAPKYEIDAVRRAVSVLRALAASGSSVGLADLGRTLGIDKATLFRLMHTLSIEGLVAQDPDTKRYRLGPDLAVLGKAAADSFDLRREARPVMERLTAEFGLPTYLNVAGSGAVVCIEHVASLSSIDLYGRAGRTMPYHACPSGYVLLAWGPAERLATVLDGPMPAYASGTPTDTPRLMQVLDESRVRGYAIGDADLEEEVSSIAAPIFGFQDEPIAALGIAGFSLVFDRVRDEIGAALLAAAREISRQGGASPLLNDTSPAHTPPHGGTT